MKNRQFFKIFVILFGSEFGKNINDLCIESQKSLVNRKADGNRCKAFAYGIHCVRSFAVIRIAVAFMSHLTVANKHH